MAYKNETKKRIIMIGPGPEGRGGISRVIKIWKAENLLKENNIKFISTGSGSGLSIYFLLFRSLFVFTTLCFYNYEYVYIHTASRNSFFRKLLFIVISVLFSKKVILHIHPSYFYTFILNFRGPKRSFIFYFLNKIESYVVLTKNMEDNIRLLFPQKRVYVLRNPINFEVMKNKKGIIRDKNRLLFLGWYVKVKGVFDLIDAVQIINEQGRDIKLELYGTHKINDLKCYVRQKKLENVNVNGWIDDNEKLEALYRSTMLILPSDSEGIPNVILEAMATKTPIVATAVGGLKEILIDRNNALIVKAKNPVDLSSKILEMLRYADLREDLAINAYKLAQREFDVNVIKEKFNKMLEKEFS